jgi:8-oxo-dGTP pyrophosphatase MutT (NUDIX family)
MLIDKIAWIHIADRKILITRSKGKDTYYIPGGKREIGETDAQTLVREVQEELSVGVVPDSIEYMGTFEAQAHGKAEGVTVRMTCYTGQYEGQLAPSNEIDEMAWFIYADRPRTAPVDHLIFDWLKERNLID